MMMQAFFLLALCANVLMDFAHPLSWYDFLERSPSKTYRDLVGAGLEATGGEETEEGVRFSPSNPWKTSAGKAFMLPVPQKTNFSIYFAFYPLTQPVNILEIWSSNEVRPFAWVQYNRDSEIKLCVRKDDECTYAQKVDAIHSGMLLTIEDAPAGGQTLALSISNVFVRISTRHSTLNESVRLKFPLGQQAAFVYILGVMSGVLKDGFYLSYLHHPNRYPPIACTSCNSTTTLSCATTISAKPNLYKPRTYRCLCIWPFHYQDSIDKCLFPRIFGCGSKCGCLCNSNGDLCYNCKSPWAPIEADGDFLKCGCPPGTAYQESTKQCRVIVSEGCDPGCPGKCDKANPAKCAFGCRRVYEASAKDGDFMECKCPENTGYEASTNSCVELSRACLKGCNDYCDRRHPGRCNKKCKNTLLFADIDGDMGTCRCQYPKGYQESTVTCENVVTNCGRGCRRCLEKDPLKCYFACNDTFVDNITDGEFRTCMCPAHAAYQASLNACVDIEFSQCASSCLYGCSSRDHKLCQGQCLAPFVKKQEDGDYFLCRCPPHTASLSNESCLNTTNQGCAPGCAGECLMGNHEMCAFSCKDSYYTLDWDGDFVECYCGHNSEIDPDTKECVLKTYYTRAVLSILLPALLLIGVALAFCFCFKPRAPDPTLARIRRQVGLVRLKEIDARNRKALQMLEARKRALLEHGEAADHRRTELRDKFHEMLESPEARSRRPEADKVLLEDNKLFCEKLLGVHSLLEIDAQIARRTAAQQALAADIQEREDALQDQAEEGKLNIQSFVEVVGNCALCHDKPAVLANDCGHVMCEPCYSKLLRSNAHCPVCQATLNIGAKVNP